MNLVLEYLVRTWDLLQLLKFPFGLAGLIDEKNIDSLQQRIWYTFHKLGDNIVLREWDFFKYNGILPSFKEVILNNIEDRTFLKPNFFPLKFVNTPTETSLNSYNHPMLKEEYEFFTNNQLNNQKHNQYKLDWLWDTFALYFRLKTSVRYLVHEYNYCEETFQQFCKEEQSIIRYRMPEAWQVWQIWQKTFIFTSNIASELIFASI